MSLSIKNYNSQNNKNISFQAQLTINTQKAFYKGREMISKKEIATLQEMAKKIGSKKDMIVINIDEPVVRFFRHHFRTYVVKTYNMSASTLFRQNLDSHSLSQSLKKENPIKSFSLFADGFEKNSPFEVLKNWLTELKKQHK